MHRKERGFCMDKMIHRRLLLFYLLFAAASGAVLAIARVLMMYQWYDPIGQMYERGTSIPVVFRILTVVACGALCTSFFLFRKKGALWIFVPQRCLLYFPVHYVVF